MKRDLTFVKDGPIWIALGIDNDRTMLHQKMVADMIEDKCTLQHVIEIMNAKGDLTDAEWTTLMYVLGYYQGVRSQ